jgi:hypothetical protein
MRQEVYFVVFESFEREVAVWIVLFGGWVAFYSCSSFVAGWSEC